MGDTELSLHWMLPACFAHLSIPGADHSALAVEVLSKHLSNEPTNKWPLWNLNVKPVAMCNFGRKPGSSTNSSSPDPPPILALNAFRPWRKEKHKKGRKCYQPTLCLRCCPPSYQTQHQPDIDKCEGWRKFYRLLKNVCCLTDFLNLPAKLIYFTNLQWAHQSLWVILFLPELTAKIQAAHPNSHKIIINPFPDACPGDPRQFLNGETNSRFTGGLNAG